jgi:ribosome-binding ATPase YchF (GTP1/OBG family)
MPHLNEGNPALTLKFSDEDTPIVKGFYLLSSKKTIYACNVAEDELAAAQADPKRSSSPPALRKNSSTSIPPTRPTSSRTWASPTPAFPR